MWRLPLALVVAIGLVGCGRGSSGGAPAAPAAGHLAKQRIPAGWTEQSRDAYDEKTIFDYIDGGADRYLKQGFRRLHAARYASAAADEVTVDLYDLGQPENAAAIYAATPVPKPRPVTACDEALGHDYGLKLRRGRVYGEITASRADPALQTAAAAFARAVCWK
ncbi:MAG: hypothetical protein HY906_00875 [Deltaproteobacteria bacterium]|nr:hypothetical protein [Deltaproteobacteria bacterium]